MSTPQQPPPSRREARRAAHQAAAANLDGLVEPGPGSESDGRLLGASAPASSAPSPTTPAPAAPAPAAPAPSEGRFRARDFRAPSERDRGAGSAPSLAPDPDDAPLTYRTAVRSPASVSSVPSAMSAPSVPSPWVPVPTVEPAPAPSASSGEAASPPIGSSHVDGEPIDERRMSRRELRARRASEDDTSTPTPTPAAFGREVPEVPAVAAAAVAPILEPAILEPPVLEPPVPEPPVALVEPPLLAPPGESAQPQSATATGTHWSVGVHQSDDNPFENTFSRQVGSAPVSTNALVLPAMPMAAITGPVPGTGEIIITGMIDLPASISSTGSAVHESPDLDDFFEVGEREVASAEAAPVSAINAVSGHTTTRMVMAGGKPRGNTVTIVLVASTVVMAVAAVTIFVVAAVNGLF